MIPVTSPGRRALLGVLAPAVLAASSPAVQQQVCYTDEIPLAPTNWVRTFTLPKFDPDLGLLVGIRFTLSAEAQGTASVESLDGAPTTVNSAFMAELTLTRPDLSVIVVTTPVANFTDNLSSFDGVIDFAGTSGRMHQGILTADSDTANSPPPRSDLPIFTGPPGNPGTIDLPVFARGISTATGSGNLITQFQTSASSQVEVCYFFELDCNANGIPDSQDVDLGNSPDGNGDGIPDECQPSTSSVCEGDGAANGGLDCPCGNNGNPGEGCDNGTGSGGLLSASGTPSLANDSLVLTASQIPNTAPGYFFYSPVLANGGNGAPFGQGLRCLDFAVRVRKSDGGGTIPSGAMPPLSVVIGATPGSTSYFQYWYRNATGPCPAMSANTTNAVMVVWGL